MWSLPWSEEQGNHPDVELLAILDHDHPVRTGTLTTDGGVVASATDTGDIYLWSTDDPSSPLSVLDEVTNPFLCVYSVQAPCVSRMVTYTRRQLFILLGGRYVSSLNFAICRKASRIFPIASKGERKVTSLLRGISPRAILFRYVDAPVLSGSYAVCLSAPVYHSS